MSAVSDFVADPLGFCAKNVVVVTCSTPQMLGQPIVKLTLVPETQGWPGLKRGNPCPVYELVRAVVGHTESFDSYWCPFVPDTSGGLGVVVGSDARFMFTDRMTGCTLGIGSNTATGNRLVLHANSQAAGVASGAVNPRGQMEAQAAAQDQAITGQATALGVTIKPKNRIGPGRYGGGYKHVGGHAVGALLNSSTTFGVFDPKGRDWHFYTLTYRVQHMQYIHMSCKKRK